MQPDEFSFKPWPKMARLDRDIVITEKIDGTNSAVVIVPSVLVSNPHANEVLTILPGPDGRDYCVGAQSRKNMLTGSSDNFGFANWVKFNAQTLIDGLGEGTHFGEWWGSGIQRGYGLKNGEKYFSLFNTHRWGHLPSAWYHHLDGSLSTIRLTANEASQKALVEAGVRSVPVLATSGWMSRETIEGAIKNLEGNGSYVAEFGDPEGIVIFHTASNMMFKKTLKNDEKPKGQS